MTAQVLEKLKSMEARYDELTRLVSDPSVQADPPTYRTHAKALAELQPLVDRYREHDRARQQLAEAREVAQSADPELRALAEEEIADLERQLAALYDDIQVLLIPKDPDDDRNVVLEIRAGTGGDEAALFAADLFRMYSRYAERHGWKVDVLSSNETGVGGLKEAIASTRAVSTACSAFPPPRPADGFIPRRRPWPCCRKPRMSTCTSTRRICASTSSARAGRAVRA